MEIGQLHLGKGIKRFCIRCRHFNRLHGNIGECRKYGFEITLELAKQSRICEDFELHHAMPKGNFTPTRRKKNMPLCTNPNFCSLQNVRGLCRAKMNREKAKQCPWRAIK